MKRLIAAIIVMLPLLFTQPAAGCVTAGSDVAASLASATTCLEIPAGVYAVGAATSGAWLNAPQDGIEIRGAGEGLTILKITAPLTLTSDLAVLRLFGVAQRVHDLTIDLGSGHSGAGNLAGISVYGSGGLGPYVGRAERTTIERVEVLGGYSATGAGGYGIGTYRASTDAGGAQWVTIRDCYIHDSPATGIGVNSSNNLILNNHVARVGTNSLSHGIYAQGGYNLYQGNTIEAASGYSFHGYKQVPNLDASGDRYIGNTSINPGSGHIVINGPLTRSATISGNVFRNTSGKRSTNGVWCNGVPCVIEGNTLEDTFVTSGGGWIEDSGGSVIEGNTLTTTGTAPDGSVNFNMIKVSGAGAIIANNRITMSVGCCAAMSVLGSASVVQGNIITLSGTSPLAFGSGLVIGGDGQMMTGNRVTSTGVMTPLALSGTPTNVLMSGNYFKRAPALGALFSLNLAGVTGRISGNMYDGSYTFSNAAPGVVQ